MDSTFEDLDIFTSGTTKTKSMDVNTFLGSIKERYFPSGANKRYDALRAKGFTDREALEVLQLERQPTGYFRGLIPFFGPELRKILPQTVADFIGAKATRQGAIAGRFVGPRYSAGKFFDEGEKLSKIHLEVEPVNRFDEVAKAHDIGHAIASSIKDKDKRVKFYREVDQKFLDKIKDIPVDYLTIITNLALTLIAVGVSVNIRSFAAETQQRIDRLEQSINYTSRELAQSRNMIRFLHQANQNLQQVAALPPAQGMRVARNYIQNVMRVRGNEVVFHTLNQANAYASLGTQYRDLNRLRVAIESEGARSVAAQNAAAGFLDSSINEVAVLLSEWAFEKVLETKDETQYVYDPNITEEDLKLYSGKLQEMGEGDVLKMFDKVYSAPEKPGEGFLQPEIEDIAYEDSTPKPPLLDSPPTTSSDDLNLSAEELMFLITEII